MKAVEWYSQKQSNPKFQESRNKDLNNENAAVTTMFCAKQVNFPGDFPPEISPSNFPW